MRFLFTMEYIGQELWQKRYQIIKLYKQNIKAPCININSSCGISKADFDIICDELRGYI